MTLGQAQLADGEEEAPIQHSFALELYLDSGFKSISHPWQWLP